MSAKMLDVFVDDYTSPCPYTLSSKSTIKEADELMATHGVRHIPIVDEASVPQGILSERDVKLLRQSTEVGDELVTKYMIEDPYIVVSGTPLEKVAYEMSTRKIGSAIVVTPKGQLDGIFTSTDALNALVEGIRGEFEDH
ncbi:CBS domain-containing protein [Bacteriovoracaceae bacterium]|nr:CBS domain-containing protein [Bacteriovoracaceae bacterium]